MFLQKKKKWSVSLTLSWVEKLRDSCMHNKERFTWLCTQTWQEAHTPRGHSAVSLWILNPHLERTGLVFIGVVGWGQLNLGPHRPPYSHHENRRKRERQTTGGEGGGAREHEADKIRERKMRAGGAAIPDPGPVGVFFAESSPHHSLTAAQQPLAGCQIPLWLMLTPLNFCNSLTPHLLPELGPRWVCALRGVDISVLWKGCWHRNTVLSLLAQRPGSPGCTFRFWGTELRIAPWPIRFDRELSHFESISKI